MLSIVAMVWWLKIAMYLSWPPGWRTTAPEGESHRLLAARSWDSSQVSWVGSIDPLAPPALLTVSSTIPRIRPTSKV